MDNFFLKFNAVQICEKFARMEHFLEVCLDNLPYSDKAVASTYLQYLNSIKAEFFSMLQYYKHKVNGTIESALLKHTSSCFHALDELHSQLSFIHGHWTPPETFVFIKSLAPLGHFEHTNKNLSVLLSDSYMFEEFDLGQYLSGSQGAKSGTRIPTPTLLLPKMEFENPLQWGTLVHEIGHVIYEPEKSIFTDSEIIEMSKGTQLGKEMVNNWVEEIFCDLLSLHLLGPAYLASFVEFITVIGSEGLLESYSNTHPPPRFRIVLMWHLLKKRKLESELIKMLNSEYSGLAEFYYTLFEERCEIDRNSNSLKNQKSAPLSFDMNLFRNKIEERVDGIVPLEKSISAFNVEKFKFLFERLAKGVPIGAYSKEALAQQDPSYLDKIKEINGNMDKSNEDSGPSPSSVEKSCNSPIIADMDILFQRIKEEPCKTAEIINAGWLYKIEKIYKPMIENISNINLDNYLDYKSSLLTLDRLLRYSIETSYLGKLFTKGV